MLFFKEVIVFLCGLVLLALKLVFRKQKPRAKDFDFPKFSFTRTRQMITVYFHEDFYIGEVTKVNSSDKGVNNLMEKEEAVS